MDHHLVDNLQRFLLRTAPNGDHIASRHACIIDRAMQRNRASDTTNSVMATVMDGSLDATLLGMQHNDTTFDGFDVFGELFSVDSLL